MLSFIFNRKHKKAENKKYYIVADENKNYLGYVSYSLNENKDKIKEDTFWVVDKENALFFTNLKLASVLMNELGDCYIKEEKELEHGR